jgi:hypothetical protein
MSAPRLRRAALKGVAQQGAAGIGTSSLAIRRCGRDDASFLPAAGGVLPNTRFLGSMLLRNGAWAKAHHLVSWRWAAW